MIRLSGVQSVYPRRDRCFCVKENWKYIFRHRRKMEDTQVAYLVDLLFHTDGFFNSAGGNLAIFVID